MRKFHLIGLAFAAVFAFSMVAASGASAEFTLWDQCTKAVPEFMSPDCLGTAGTAWGWEEIKTLLPVDSLPADLILENLGLITIRILCEGTMDGSVGATGEDEITELLTTPGGVQITLAKPVACTNLENCVTPMAAPENLPWSTQLVEATSEDAAGDLLGQGTGGEPKWWAKCGSTENECGKADSILLVATNTDELEVVFTFPSEADTTYLPLATCTNAFEKEGLVSGTVGILLENGNALRAM